MLVHGAMPVRELIAKALGCGCKIKISPFRIKSGDGKRHVPRYLVKDGRSAQIPFSCDDSALLGPESVRDIEERLSIILVPANDAEPPQA